MNPLDYKITDPDAMKYALMNDAGYKKGGQVKERLFDEQDKGDWFNKKGERRLPQGDKKIRSPLLRPPKGTRFPVTDPKMEKDFDFSSYPIKKVPVDDLYSIQNNVREDNLKPERKHGRPIHVVIWKGKYWVVDGNHRASEFWAAGEKNIHAHVLNLDDHPEMEKKIFGGVKKMATGGQVTQDDPSIDDMRFAVQSQKQYAPEVPQVTQQGDVVRTMPSAEQQRYLDAINNPSVMDQVVGAGEAGMSFLTGIPAYFAGIAGYGKGLVTGQDPNQTGADLESKLQYQPTTPMGQERTEQMNNVLNALDPIYGFAGHAGHVGKAPSIAEMRAGLRLAGEQGIEAARPLHEAYMAGEVPGMVNPASYAVKPHYHGSDVKGLKELDPAAGEGRRTKGNSVWFKTNPAEASEYPSKNSGVVYTAPFDTDNFAVVDANFTGNRSIHPEAIIHHANGEKTRVGDLGQKVTTDDVAAHSKAMGDPGVRILNVGDKGKSRVRSEEPFGESVAVHGLVTPTEERSLKDFERINPEDELSKIKTALKTGAAHSAKFASGEDIPPTEKRLQALLDKVKHIDELGTGENLPSVIDAPRSGAVTGYHVAQDLEAPLREGLLTNRNIGSSNIQGFAPQHVGGAYFWSHPEVARFQRERGFEMVDGLGQHELPVFKMRLNKNKHNLLPDEDAGNVDWTKSYTGGSFATKNPVSFSDLEAIYSGDPETTKQSIRKLFSTNKLSFAHGGAVKPRPIASEEDLNYNLDYMRHALVRR
jgi:hypothetical protein